MSNFPFLVRRGRICGGDVRVEIVAFKTNVSYSSSKRPGIRGPDTNYVSKVENVGVENYGYACGDIIEVAVVPKRNHNEAKHQSQNIYHKIVAECSAGVLFRSFHFSDPQGCW